MYYLKKYENYIEKYEVKFERRKIEQLKNIVINRCSEIVHVEYTTTHIKTPKQNYKNYHCFAHDVRKHEAVFTVVYDEYKYPELVYLIIRLLNGDMTVISEIENYNSTSDTEKIAFEDKIMDMSAEIDKIPNIEVEKKIDRLKMFQKFLEHVKLNANQESTEQYYLMLKELIYLEIVDTISLDEIDEKVLISSENSQTDDNENSYALVKKQK